MATVSITWEVDGTPTDVYSAKLSDPTGTYGVRRTDTSATVVADNTAMSHAGTGEYTYNLGDISVRHEAWVEIVEDVDEPDVLLWRQIFVEADAAVGVESTLSVTRSDLRIEVADYYGLSTDSGDWNTKNTDRINRAVANGERMFYRSLQLPGEQSIHRWKFLQVIGEFELDAGDGDYDLPATFAGFVDPVLRFLAEDGEWHSVQEVPVTTILRNRQIDVGSASNSPEIYAVVPKAADQTNGQRYQLMVDPAPSAAVTLTGLQKVNPFAITSGEPYPLGGQPHAETLRAAVVAAAEMDRYGSRGDMYQRFLELMRDSIAIDRADNTPKSFGYNGDRSGCPDSDLPWERHRIGTVTFPWS